MKPASPHRLVRSGTRAAWILAGAIAALFATRPARAAEVTWDTAPGTLGLGDAAITGGSGAWDEALGNWTLDAGLNNIPWVNGNIDTAIFGGIAGTVTLATGITVGGLTFHTAPGYLITGDTVTVATAGAITTHVDAEIGSVIAGADPLTKTGSATLTLSGASTYTGATIISEGTLKLRPGTLAVTSDLNLRLDATSLTGFTNGASVGTWNDTSGNGRNATGGTSPAYVAANPAFNNLPTVHFNGSTQYMNVDLTFLAGNAYTIFAVVAKNNNIPNRTYFLGNNTGAFNQSNRLLQCGWGGDTSLKLAQYNNDLNWDGAPAYSGSEVAFIYGGKLDKSSGHFIYYNDVLKASRTDTTPLSSSTSGAIGKVALRRGNGGSIYEDNWFNGDIGEILVYNAALSDTQRQSVDAYLNTKWGLGISGLAGNGGDNRLPPGTALTIAPNAILDMGGSNQTLAALAGGSGTVQNSNTTLPSTLTLSPSVGGTQSFPGAIIGGDGLGTVNLVMNGTGTQVLTGSNTYAGNTTINAGTLVLAAGGSLRFVVTDESNSLIAGTGSVTVDGIFTIDTSAVTVISGSWTLLSVVTQSFDSNFRVSGFDPNGDGVTWTKNEGGRLWTFDEITGTLIVALTPDYTTWSLTDFGTPFTDTHPAHDPDRDGMTNFEEYAYGLNPTSGASANPISQQLDMATGLFKYTRRATPTTTGLAYTYEWSGTLGNDWQPFTPDSASSDNGSPVEEITVDVPAAQLANPKLFLRVKASE